MPKVKPKPEFHQLYAVYGDYDGNAPDTRDLLWCRTEKEANAYAKKLHALAHSDDEDEEDEEDDDQDEDQYEEEDDQDQDLSEIIPFCDGWQHSLSFSVRKVVVSDKALHRTLWYCYDDIGEACGAKPDEW